MKKDLTGLVETLGKSVLEIANSTVDNRDALLKQSLGEFQEALLGSVAEFLPLDEEPLAKGLNHIATFANALRDLSNRVHALQTGQPRWMVSNDGDAEPEILPPEIADDLDAFLNHGIIVLRRMVNDTAELPADEAELQRMEEAGALVKIENSFGGPAIFVGTGLPDQFAEYLRDPTDLVADMADLGRYLQDQALELTKAEGLADDPEIGPLLWEAYPELFEKADAVAPPKKKPPQRAGSGAGLGEDESVGAGGNNPDSAADPGDGAGDQNVPGAAAGGDGDAGLTDDAPQNPIEMMVRLASIIVVVGGSVLQAGAGATDATGATGDVSGMPDDTSLQRGTPIEDVPLAKILAGQVAVDPSLADALEQLAQWNIEGPTLRKSLENATGQLAMLQATVDRLQKTPAPPKGFINTTGTIGKSEDVANGMPTGGSGPLSTERLLKAAGEVEALRDVDPEGAARALLKITHASGGRPYVAIEG